MQKVFRKLGIYALMVLLSGASFFVQESNAQIVELDDAIGGNGLLPANPDFDFGPFLKLRGQDLYQPLAALSSNQVAAVEIETSLAQALQQSISVTNRPSVLTPYSETIISREGKEYDDVYGSYVTNKARTIGKGILGVGLSYQYSNFNKFNGNDIGDAASSEKTQTIMLQNVFVGGTPSPLVSGPLDVASRVVISDVDIRVNQIVLALNYGVLSNLDIGVLIPFLHINTTGEITMEIEQDFRGGSVPGDSLFELDFRARSRDKFDRDYEGVGDIVVFSKLQILSQFDEAPRINAPVDLATQVEVKLPSGDERSFLGNGDYDAALRLLVQKSFGETQRFTVRGDLGGTFSGLDQEFHSAEAKLGVEVRVHERLGLSAEVINIYNPAYELVSDFAAGGKVKFTRNFKAFGGFRMPINQNGLRAPFSPIAGFEYTLDTRPLIESGKDLLAFRETTISDQDSIALANSN